MGHVDVSVFLAPHVAASAHSALAVSLRREPLVHTVYVETAKEAYAEYQRLYTCWTRVPASAVPASYRLVLTPTVTVATRDGLVSRLVHEPGVASVSCDPTTPCVDVVRSAEATPTPR